MRRCWGSCVLPDVALSDPEAPSRLRVCASGIRERPTINLVSSGKDSGALAVT